MYCDNNIANGGQCKCQAPNQCISKKQCQCESFCYLYAEQVKKWASCQCMTISPDPKLFITIKQANEYWQGEFLRLLKCTDDYIIVLELDGCRPHYHCAIVVNDIKKFTNLVYGWKINNNVKTHGIFKGKLHYMFKDVIRTYQATGIVPIFERGDHAMLKKFKDEKKAECLMQRKREALNELKKEIPKWMLKTEEDM